MTPETPETNRQAGVPLNDAENEAPEVVATGDRRDEVHYEADPDQLVKMRTLVKPDGPIPPEVTTPEDRAFDEGREPVEDIQVAPASPSVWDARPPADDAERSGNPTGH